MSALLAAQGQSSTATTASAPTSRSDALKDLFSQLDANGDGQISKSEFENALGAGGTNLAQADNVFGKLDKNGDGSVSLDELSSALKGKGHHHHHHAASADGSGGADGSNSDPLAAGVERRIVQLRHQQRRLDHDVGDLCRWIESDDDLARGDDVILRRDVVLQFHRTDDSARGAGDFDRSHRVALAQRLNRLSEALARGVAGYPNRSFHAGSAPGKGSAVAA